MSLEAKIEALTEQVTQLTDAVTVLKNVLIAHSQGKTIPSLDSIVHELAGAPVTNLAPAEEGPNEKPSTTTDTSPPSSNESRTVTYDDVRNVTIAVSKIDKAKAVAGLARFQVTTAKALPEEQWADFVVHMNRVLSGELE